MQTYTEVQPQRENWWEKVLLRHRVTLTKSVAMPGASVKVRTKTLVGCVMAREPITIPEVSIIPASDDCGVKPDNCVQE